MTELNQPLTPNLLQQSDSHFQAVTPTDARTEFEEPEIYSVDTAIAKAEGENAGCVNLHHIRHQTHDVGISQQGKATGYHIGQQTNPILPQARRMTLGFCQSCLAEDVILDLRVVSCRMEHRE